MVMREVVGVGYAGIAAGRWSAKLSCGHYIRVASRERAEGLAAKRRMRKCKKCSGPDDDVVKEIERRGG